MTAHLFWAWEGAARVRFASPSVTTPNKSRSNPGLNTTRGPMPHCTRMKVQPSITSRKRDATPSAFVKPAASMPATTTVTASAKSTATPRKASGPDSATSYACFAVCTRNTWAAYAVMFEWAHILKRVTADFLRTLMIPSFTYLPT
jgi:hypothetical protein